MLRIILISLMISTTACYAQDNNPTYDSVLAKSLGADDYGMKNYIFVILRTGEYNTEVKAERDSLFRGHMENINKLADAGRLVVAGPFGKNDKNYRGLFILNTTSIEEAEQWLAGDAAVNAKLFDVEYIKWYGSAALPTYLPVHSTISKKQF